MVVVVPMSGQASYAYSFALGPVQDLAVGEKSQIQLLHSPIFFAFDWEAPCTTQTVSAWAE